MKKSIIAGFLALTLLLSLTACSGNEKNIQNGNDCSEAASQTNKETEESQTASLEKTILI